MNKLIILSLCLSTLSIIGCGEQSASPEQTSDDKTDSSHQQTDSPPPEWANSAETGPDSSQEPEKAKSLAFESLDLEGYREAIANQQGKVVLVDFWATWCIPCRKSFPHTVELAEKYKNEGLVVMTVACDDEIAEHQVGEFLAKQNAEELMNFRSVHGSEDESFQAFEIGDTGLPHYKLYSKSGELLKTYFIDAAGEPIDQTAMEELIKKSLGL